MSTYTEAREEAAENWLETRVAAVQAQWADYDRDDDGGYYHVADNGNMEPT